MCTYVFDSSIIDAFKLEFDREAFTQIFGNHVGCEGIRLFRHHSPHFAETDDLFLRSAHLMVDGSVEKLKFLMVGAQDGCIACARVAMDHLEREDPARKVPRLFLKISRGNRARPRRLRVDDRDPVEGRGRLADLRRRHSRVLFCETESRSQRRLVCPEPPRQARRPGGARPCSRAGGAAERPSIEALRMATREQGRLRAGDAGSSRGARGKRAPRGLGESESAAEVSRTPRLRC